MYRQLSRDSIELEYQHLEEIAKAYPELSIDTVKFKDDGLTYDIISVNNEWIFRFPKYDWAAEDMVKEAACIEVASRHVSLPLPAWEMSGRSFVRYRKIAGTVLTPHEFGKLDREKQERIVSQLAETLSSMHAVAKTELAEAGIGESLTSHSYDDWLKLYDDVQQELYDYMTASAKAAVDALFRKIIGDNTFTEYTPAFINGELNDYHLIFDPAEGELKTIIDFGSAGLGDPATDIACLLMQYGELFVSRLSRYYPGLPDLIDRARFISATYPLQWALGGIRTGDFSWFLVHLGRAGCAFPFSTPLVFTDST
jgi:aminoglycoside 2''-phosphotransferase